MNDDDAGLLVFVLASLVFLVGMAFGIWRGRESGLAQGNQVTVEWVETCWPNKPVWTEGPGTCWVNGMKVVVE